MCVEASCGILNNYSFFVNFCGCFYCRWMSKNDANINVREINGFCITLYINIIAESVENRDHSKSFAFVLMTVHKRNVVRTIKDIGHISY